VGFNPTDILMTQVIPQNSKNCKKGSGLKSTSVLCYVYFAMNL